MTGSRNGFVNDGASRLRAVEVERIRTDVANEFAPLIAESRGLARLGLKLKRWREIQIRVEALGMPDSAHINWFSR